MRTEPVTGDSEDEGTLAEGYHAHKGRSTGDPERDRLLQRIMVAGRELGLSLISLNTATARANGSHPTDAWIISYLHSLPDGAPLTPSDLARITGLTTGAISGVIDRLERDGCVVRERDPDDQRKVIIVPTAASEKLVRLYQPMVDGYRGLCSMYATEELARIISYFEGIIAVTEDTVSRLREA